MALPKILQNLRLPVIGSPMFIVSGPELVIAQCKAGIVGSFPALNARPQPVLDEWLDRITTELAEYSEKNPDRPAAPFAVNQIVHKSNDRLMEDLDLCVKYKVPIIITSLGARKDLNETVHSYGGIVLHDIINVFFAKKALQKGADGLIAVLTVPWRCLAQSRMVARWRRHRRLAQILATSVQHLLVAMRPTQLMATKI